MMQKNNADRFIYKYTYMNIQIDVKLKAIYDKI